MLNKTVRKVWRYDPDVNISNINETVDAILKEYNSEAIPPSELEIITNAQGLVVASMLEHRGLPVKKLVLTVRGVVSQENWERVNSKLEDIRCLDFLQRLWFLFKGRM